jgi:hypothetical protein
MSSAWFLIEVAQRVGSFRYGSKSARVRVTRPTSV